MPNVFDIAALVIIAFGTIQGLRRGLSGELARLVSVVVALVLSLYFYHPFGVWCTEHTRLTVQAAHVLAFVTMVAGAMAATVLLRFLLKKIMKIVIEKKVDKAGGCVAGFISTSVFVLIIFLMMNMLPDDHYLNQKFGEESVIGSIVVHCMPLLHEAVENKKFILPGRQEED